MRTVMWSRQSLCTLAERDLLIPCGNKRELQSGSALDVYL